MSRARPPAVSIILAMFVGLLLLPLQGRAARVVEATNAVQSQAACVDGTALLASVMRPRIAVRPDAMEDADDAAPPHPCVVAVAQAAGVVVVGAPAMRVSLVRADRPRARGPP